jgi:hypothetical protein
MNRHIVFRIVLVLVLTGAVIALGALAYDAGVRQGIVMGAQTAAGSSEQALYPPYMAPYGAPWVGFGGLLCVGAVVFVMILFLVFGLARAFSWRRHWAGHAMHRGPWATPPGTGSGEAAQAVPPIFTEWHRRAHAAPSDDSARV